MATVHNILNTIGSIHVNAAITIWSFLTDNLLMIGVVGVMSYMAYEELKLNEHLFLQDNRRIL